MIFSLASSSAVVIRITNLSRLLPNLVTARIGLPPSSVVVMSSVSRKELVEEKDKDEKKKKMLPEEVQSSKPARIPEAPEKPLPDDCCGSGCVRCVWDVYYEELEEYNNLLRSVDSTEQTSEINRSN